MVDGVASPTIPFDPTAPAISRDKPLMVGWNEDEYTFFAWERNDSTSFNLDFDAFRAQPAAALRHRYGAHHRSVSSTAGRPRRQPTSTSRVQSVTMMGLGSIEIAERKALQQAVRSTCTTSATSQSRRSRVPTTRWEARTRQTSRSSSTTSASPSFFSGAGRNASSRRATWRRCGRRSRAPVAQLPTDNLRGRPTTGSGGR